MKRLRKALILTHRYLGLPLSLLFMLWFASGITMIYAGGMPRLTPELRLMRLAPLDLARVRVMPADLAQQASGGGDRTTLLTVMDRPAYRVGQATIFADTGERLGEVGRGGALTIASRFTNLPADTLRYVGELSGPDQWTIAQARQMPLHKIAVDDGARTELYVSEQSGEVAVMTTRGSRALAWVAAIPHWLYFAPLRVNGRLWQQTVIWLSALGSIFAVLGVVVGILQWRPSTPHIPYAGWMRWHHLGGLVFGVVTLTWVLSGLLSMDPWAWPSKGPDLDFRGAFGRARDLSRFPPLDAEAWRPVMAGAAIKEVEYTWIQDEPYYVVRGDWKSGRLLVAADTMQTGREPSSAESLLSRVKNAVPDVSILGWDVLSTYDSYYYQRDGGAALPVIRIKFGDPDSTWLYVDPLMNQVVGTFRRYDRLGRWLYHGFHSLDFSFWYYRRPLWDIGVITLCLGGFAVSSIGFFLGVRRMWRGIRRIAL
ncbi:MAG: PepSY domain-containing protein [Vicinamibacterales bacterium]